MKVFSLSLLKYLENNNFGEIDRDLFWNKLTLDRKGVYISDIGGNQSRGVRPTYSFELYSRGKDDLDGYERLARISEFLSNKLGVSISLPETGYTEEGFDCVVFESISTPTFVERDTQGRMIYAITGLARVN